MKTHAPHLARTVAAGNAYSPGAHPSVGSHTRAIPTPTLAAKPLSTGPSAPLSHSLSRHDSAAHLTQQLPADRRPPPCRAPSSHPLSSPQPAR